MGFWEAFLEERAQEQSEEEAKLREKAKFDSARLLDDSVFNNDARLVQMWNRVFCRVVDIPIGKAIDEADGGDGYSQKSEFYVAADAVRQKIMMLGGNSVVKLSVDAIGAIYCMHANESGMLQTKNPHKEALSSVFILFKKMIKYHLPLPQDLYKTIIEQNKNASEMKEDTLISLAKTLYHSIAASSVGGGQRRRRAGSGLTNSSSMRMAKSSTAKSSTAKSTAKSTRTPPTKTKKTTRVARMR